MKKTEGRQVVSFDSKNDLVFNFSLLYDRDDFNHDRRGEYNENEND
jgi:hypothetical protein